MSLMSIRRFFTKYGTPIWILLVLTFVAGSFTVLGSNLFRPSSGPGSAAAASAGEKIAATVGAREVTSRELDLKLNQQLEQQRQYLPTPPSPGEYPALRLRLLDQFKQEQALLTAAEKAGLSVTPADIERVRDEAFAQNRGQLAQALSLKPDASDREMDAALAKTSQNVTIAAYKAAVLPDERVRPVALFGKMQDSFKAKVASTVTPQRVRDNYSEIKVRHILLKTGEGGLPEEQARGKAQKLLDAVKKDPASFARLADENTQDPGNAGPGGKKQGGFYDWAPASRYVPEFSGAALSVKPGQIVPNLVKTNFGFHVVKLEGIRPGKDLPKDFDKNVKKYTDEFVAAQASQQAQAAIAAVLPSVPVKIQDPVLRAAQLQTEAQGTVDTKARDAKLAEAVAELNKIKPGDDPLGEAALMRATISETQNKPAEAIAAYETALKQRDDMGTRLALARLYVKQKNNASAVTQIQAAEKMVRGDLSGQFQIAQLYRDAGAAQLADAAGKKASEMAKRQAELNKAAGAGGPGGANTITLPPTASGTSTTTTTTPPPPGPKPGTAAAGKPKAGG